MSTALDATLKILSDADQEIPVDRLADLSDLDTEQIGQFSPIWEGLPLERRRTLIRLLGEEAYAHVELDFERVYRLSLDDQDPDVRQLAIDNLWECEDPSLIAPFVRALASDVASNVRRSAAAALGRYVFLGAVEQIRPELLRDMEEALLAVDSSDETLEVRRAALESMGYSSRPEIPDLITQAYQSGSEPFVVSALVAIARSANDEWGPQVQAQLNSPSPAIRLAAVRAAGELELIETVPDLVELLEDASEDVRRAAIWSLGQLGGDVAKQVLGDLLDSTEDSEEFQLAQDAIDNLAFVDGSRDLFMFNLDTPDAD